MKDRAHAVVVPTMPIMIDTVVLAAPRGFCAGVEMAIKALTWMVRVFPAPVYCYHEIVHNATVVSAFGTGMTTDRPAPLCGSASASTGLSRSAERQPGSVQRAAHRHRARRRVIRSNVIAPEARNHRGVGRRGTRLTPFEGPLS